MDKKNRPTLSNTSSLPGNSRGFTLLELIIVMFLISIMLLISTVYLANTLPKHKFNATVRDFTATIRHARSLAQMKGELQTVVIDLDARTFGIEGLGTKEIPASIKIKALDPFIGDISTGKYSLAFPPLGGAEAGTIVLSNEKNTATVTIDPVVGSVVTR